MKFRLEYTWLICLCLAAGWACDDDAGGETNDAGIADSSAADADEDDAEPGNEPDAEIPDRRDAATPQPDAHIEGELCQPCGPMGECPHGICLTVDSTGEQFCGVDCSETGLCPDDGNCFDIGDGGRQCAPANARCSDTPPIAPETCAPCEPTCGAGAICLTNNATSEQFCGLDCTNPADKCPRHTECVSIGDTLSVCLPFGGTCVGWPPSDIGIDCARDAGCVNGADRCVFAGDARYCSRGCESDRDCPVGYARCTPDGCRADWELGPEGCGRRGDSPLVSCADGCPDGLTCATDLLGAEILPEPVAPFCTAACEDDEGCPDGTACRATASGTRICLDRACDCLGRPDASTAFDRALELAGVDRCSAIFGREVWDTFLPSLSRDPFRLSFFNAVHGYPAGALDWARALDADLAARASSPTPAAGVIERGAALLDRPVTGEPSPPEPAAEEPLIEAIAAVYAAADRADDFDRDIVAADAEGLPEPLRRAVAAVIVAEIAVHEARQTMIAALELPDDLVEALFDLIPTTTATRADFAGINMALEIVQVILRGDLDLTGLFTATRDLAHVIETADFAAFAGTEDVDFDQVTPLGRIVVHDAGQQTYDADHRSMLLVDLGGDDHYEGSVAATRDWEHTVSVLIDVAGNDTYGYDGDSEDPLHPDLPPADAAGRYAGDHENVGDAYGPMSLSQIPRQGTGILGAGLLFDLAGDDRYTSLKISQGVGLLGVGLLRDVAGSDHYTCEQGCQGNAAYGLGALIDGGGNDTYRGVQNVQGSAYVRAFAYLYDHDGDDEYRALLGDPEHGGFFIYPNAQNPGLSNSSFAQGAGRGRRADTSDGVFGSGGIGILRDSAGRDVYSVDIFGQATGFWYGTGLLSDAEGDDTYRGRWYNQGSGAHFALAWFLEGGGDDQYNVDAPIMATAVGQGHDLSLGYLWDASGNDIYSAPSLGLGGGNDNGIGVLLDGGGDDTYDTPDGTTFGGAKIGDRGERFDEQICLGLFIDGGGNDTYGELPADGLIGNNRTWTWRQRHPDAKPGEMGAGIDADGDAPVPVTP